MKLLKVSFHNFRLLKDIQLDFSTNDKNKLTIIRAENGTGKTTFMSGLIWGLYGSKVMKDKVYPFSMVEPDTKTTSIKTEVKIDFITEEVISKNSRTVINNKHYRIIRKTISKVSNDGQSYTQEQDEYNLHEITEAGTVPVPKSNIENIIERTLPVHLKDIYFTDGDAALTFIESTATTSEKRIRVKKAIEALLSLKELESIISNLKNIKLSFTKKIDKTNYGDQLLTAETQLKDKEEWVQDAQDELELNIDKKAKLDATEKSLSSKIENQLKLGDKTSLANQINDLKKQIDRSRSGITSSISSQCSILNEKSLSIDLIYRKLTIPREILNKMNDKDKFPMQFIPVLKHALSKNECLCGSNLSDSTTDGLKKRKYMTQIINDCKDIDLLNKRASNLFFSSENYNKDTENSSWLKKYEDNLAIYFDFNKTLQENVDTQKKMEYKFDELNDDLLNSYRTHIKSVKQERVDCSHEISILSSEINLNKEKIKYLKNEIDILSNKVGKNNNAGGKHLLTSKLLSIYENVFDVIKTEELQKVSLQMNDIFMSMIGVNSGMNPNGMIQGCKLTHDFDIQVLGPNNQLLDPDTELNGASRRAITLSFILALTKVSGVIAPNIIDTPLGMTSGLVKQSILKNLISQGTQVIMFLTYDEIKGVEKIIDECSGKTVTLSFAGHYPSMLKNAPLRHGESFLCNCNHKECCDICERTDQTNMIYKG